jgi:FdhD protein
MAEAMEAPGPLSDDLPPAVETRVGHRVDAGGKSGTERDIAAERPVAFVYNTTPFAVMMATPADLADFARGFSLAEGIVKRPAEVLSVAIHDRGRGLELDIAIPERRHRLLAARPRNLAGRSGCGLCGVASLDQALRPLPVVTGEGRLSAAAIRAAIAGLPGLQALNRRTRSIHAAGWFDPEGRPLLLREDVGRHNALDKLIGARVQAGLAEAPGFAVITSRLSVEMVQKAATTGIGTLVALSAPTGLAIDLARDCGLTIAASARDDGFDIWAHPERITDQA